VHSVRAILESLRKAKADERVTHVLLRPAGVTAAWGKVQEVRAAVADLRQSGKAVSAFLEHGSQAEYYMASAAERVYLAPAASLDLTGLAVYDLFLRGTLDWIGVEPDFVKIGDYKTAPNAFTEKGYTPAHREMTEALTSDLFDQLVLNIAEARKKTDAEVRRLIDEGPFLADRAVEVGLVDEALYEDELLAKADLASDERRTLDVHEYERVSLESLGLNRGDRIAVVVAAGAIGLGDSGFDPTGAGYVGSTTLNEWIKKARDDQSIKAVVLRVDSPGGSATASDLIWRELTITKDRKPVVASMSDYAASGGYYIAMAADAIVAQPGTITGSIGIFGGKLATGGTYRKIGANIESVVRGRMADIYSPLRPFSPEERAKLYGQIEAFYTGFIQKTAKSRRTTPERVDQLGRGRVWTGRQAKANGLVDELGGLDLAIRIAKQRANIPEDRDVEILFYPPQKTVYEIFFEQLYRGSGVGAARLWGPETRRALQAIAPFDGVFRRGELLALMPFTWAK
jgi:protease-4